jgi:DNA polymerase I
VVDKAQKSVMLIDGYGLIFRAYHAIDSAMSTSAGEQTNAVFGFTRMLLDVLDSQKPDYAIVALEGGKTFRHDEFDGYKANRGEMPGDLRSQIGRVRAIVDAMNIPIIEREGYEADDVIGSLSHRLADSNKLKVLIITGDSDLLQLVEPGVEAVLPGRPRFQDLRIFDLSAVEARFGFAPTLIPDYKALVGDTSDNIPGVPGIGDKTATALIQQYGDVEGILTNLDSVRPPRAKSAIEANVDRLRMSKRLATIMRDLQIEPDLDHSAVDNFDRDRVVELFRELEFRSLVNRLPESSQPSNGATAHVERAEPTRSTVTTDEGLQAIAQRITATGEYAFDVETTSVEPLTAELVGLALAASPSESWYIPVAHGDGSVSPERIAAHISPIFQNPRIKGYGHHAKYDKHVLHRYGIDVTNLEFDTMIAAYLLGENSMGLKDLAFSRLGIEMTEIAALIGRGQNQLSMNMVPLEQVAQYACGDVEATFELVNYFRPLLAEHEQEKLFREMELPLVPVLEAMERTGIAIDRAYLRDLDKEIRQRLAELDREITRMAGRTINVNSTRQLGALLFDELKLPSGRRTKTGYSVDQDLLETLRDQHPIIGVILEYKSLLKLSSTYVSALPLEINPNTGRIHTSYNQTVAATGRLSSNKPNLQNIPIRTEVGRRVRRAFVADQSDRRLFEDSVLLSADYSQIELRLMAHMSGEPFLLDAFRAGADIHRATASLVYGVDLADVTPEMRRVAKTVNFGLLYGMQAYGLSRDTGLSRADAQGFIDQYWSRLPGVKAYFDETVKKGIALGYVETLYGRRRAVPDLQSPNGQRRAAAVRIATNMPLQGTAADIMKIAMIRVHNKLASRSDEAVMLLQVHDELVLEVNRPALNEIGRLVKGLMESAAELSVPLVADLSHGPNWDDLTDFEPA